MEWIVPVVITNLIRVQAPDAIGATNKAVKAVQYVAIDQSQVINCTTGSLDVKEPEEVA